MRKQSRGTRNRLKHRARELEKLASTEQSYAQNRRQIRELWNVMLQSWQKDVRRSVLHRQPGYDVRQRIDSALRGCCEGMHRELRVPSFEAVQHAFEEAVASIGGPRSVFVHTIYRTVFGTPAAIRSYRKNETVIDELARNPQDLIGADAFEQERIARASREQLSTTAPRGR